MYSKIETTMTKHFEHYISLPKLLKLYLRENQTITLVRAPTTLTLYELEHVQNV